MKGVSDKNAQNDKKIKGNKNDVKKPIQVLHISKKETKSGKEEILDDNQNLSKDMNAETKAIKSQSIEAPIYEKKENYCGGRSYRDRRFIIDRKRICIREWKKE